MSTGEDKHSTGIASARGYAVYVFFAVCNLSISAALLLLLANVLPIKQYATFGIISSIAGLVLLFVNSGHKEALFKFASQSNVDKLSEIAQSLQGWLIIFLAVALLLLLLSPTAGLAAFMFLFLYVAIAITAVFRGRARYFKDAALWPLYRAFWLLGCSGCFMLEAELSLLQVFGVGSAAALLAFLALGGQQVVKELVKRASLQLAWPLRDPVLRQFFYVELATIAYVKVDVLLLAFFGIPSDELAAYYFSIQLFEAALLLLMPLGYLFFNRINANDPSNRTDQIFLVFAVSVLATSALVISGWTMLGEILLERLFPYYVSSNTIIGTLLIALIPWGLASLFSYSLIAGDKEGLVVRVFLMGLVFHITLNVVLISLKGSVGAAWARVATELFIASLLCFFAAWHRASTGTDIVLADKEKPQKTGQ